MAAGCPFGPAWGQQFPGTVRLRCEVETAASDFWSFLAGPAQTDPSLRYCDIEPIVAILVGAGRDDHPARLARVHAPNEDVGLSAPVFVQEFGHPFPVESP